MFSGIYKITNPNGEFYIGKSLDLKSRFNSYRSTLTGRPIEESINIHGYNNHTFEIIILCEASELNEKEKYYIRLLNPTLNVHKMGDTFKSQDISVTPGLRVSKEKWKSVKDKYPRVINNMFNEWLDSIL